LVPPSLTCYLSEALIPANDEQPDGDGWDRLEEPEEGERTIESFKRLDRNSNGRKVGKKLGPIAGVRRAPRMIVSRSISGRGYTEVKEPTRGFHDRE